MYPIARAWKQGGSILLTLPPGTKPGYYYVSVEHQEQEPREYLYVWAVPKGERPEKIHIVEQPTRPAPGPATERPVIMEQDQGTGV